MKISGYVLQKQPCRSFISPGLFVIFEIGFKIVWFLRKLEVPLLRIYTEAGSPCRELPVPPAVGTSSSRKLSVLEASGENSGII